MAKGVQVTLYDQAGSPYAAGVNIAVTWFDSDVPPNLGAIKGQSAIAVTTGSGVLSLDLDSVTSLNVGDWGFLLCYKADTVDYKRSPAFAARMQVTAMTGTTMLMPPSNLQRNPDWPALAVPVNGVQKFTGLLAVYDHDSNFVALSASAAYTVNWGDGSGDLNIATGVAAQRNLSYASVGGTIVGASTAVAVTLTDAGDLVTRTAHGFQNGQRLNFASVTGTTGVVVNTPYFVVGQTANTFQVAVTAGGAALALTTNGTGTMYVPQYKVAIVTVTPQAANNLTAFSLQVKHNQVGLPIYSTPWLSVALNGSFLTTVVVASTIIVTALTDLFEVFIGETATQSFMGVFSGCSSLKNVPPFNTSAVLNFSYMFDGCGSLQEVPFLDTSAGTNFFSMFSYCQVLKKVPLINTALGSNFSAMFDGCFSLEVVPFLNLASGTTFNRMFANCAILKQIPLFNTSSGIDFSFMYTGCTAVQQIPPINTASGTDFSSTFSFCRNLSVGVLAGTTRSISYQNCKLSAAQLDAIYTALGTAFGAQTITVTGNYGTTGHTPSIATAKGWTVTV